MNTKLRTQVTNKFEKDFFKAMKNSVFDKKMENIWNPQEMRLVTNRNKYFKLVMSPNFKNGRKFSENLTSVEMGKIKVKMMKPVYLRKVILDLSKLIM